jgi:hypothetical protein
VRTGLLAFVVAASAQESPPSDPNGSTGADQALAHEEIVRDVTDVEAKLIALAEALSEEQYAWLDPAEPRVGMLERALDREP